MKVLAFNASPRREKSVSDEVLDLFLEGAEKAGADTEKHYVVDLNINGCQGCFNCWTKTPGKCIHRDDMEWMIPKIQEADIIYYGTPIYNNNIIHYLQRMVERLLPTALPFMVEKDGQTRHPNRYERKKQKTVLAAVAGFPDESAFKHVKALYSNAMHILLPSSQIIRYPEGRKIVAEFLDAVKEAGKQIVTGDVEESVRANLMVRYTPEVKEIIREQANKHFESQIKKTWSNPSSIALEMTHLKLNTLRNPD